MTLVQKALILVAVPVAIELCLLGAASWFLSEADREANRTEHAKAVIAKANGVCQLLMDVGYAYVMYDAKTTSLSASRFDELLAGTPGELDELANLVADDPHHSKTVADVRKKTFDAIDTLREQEHTIAKGGHLNVLVATSLDMSMKGVESDLRDIIREEHEIEQRDPGAAQRLKQGAKLLLSIGALVGLIAVIVVTRFYQKSARRLEVLMDNGLRLGAGMSLSQLLPGNDEIARIDQVFHQAAASLAESARKERAIVENAADVICSIDSAGKFAKVNATAEKIWGYSPEELAGYSWRRLVSSEDVERTAQWMEKLRANSLTGTIENKIKRKDGAQAHMGWSAYWSKSDQSLFCVVHDISERLELEQFKQQFVAMISHDLRTPLSAVKSTLALLGTGTYGQLSEVGNTKVVRAEDNLRHSIELINNLLDLEKMEAGRLNLQIAEVSLLTVFQRCAAAVAALAEKRSIELELPNQNVILAVDEGRLAQVVINLLGNAIKFSPERSIVRIGIEIAGSSIKVTVTDKGPGIADSYKDFIFERYRQIPEKKESEGTGLGLAICKAIIEAHGGKIGVENAEGGGSIFWFSLPKST